MDFSGYLAAACIDMGLRASRILGSASYLFTLLTGGLGPRLLTDEGLQAMTTTFYSEASKYQDHRHTTYGFFPWEDDVISHYFPSQGTVAVAAAGAGREVVALAERGYRVIASDPHPLLALSLAETAATLGEHIRVHADDPNRFLPPGSPPQVDAAIIGWAGYCHVPGRSKRLQFLRDLSAIMTPGAPLLVSYLDRAFETPELLERLAAHIESLFHVLDAHVSWPRHPEPGDLLDGRRMFAHLFKAGEVPEDLKEVGFEIDDERLVPYAHTIARKPL